MNNGSFVFFLNAAFLSSHFVDLIEIYLRGSNIEENVFMKDISDSIVQVNTGMTHMQKKNAFHYILLV